MHPTRSLTGTTRPGHRWRSNTLLLAAKLDIKKNPSAKLLLAELQYHLCDKHKITGQCNPIRTKQQLKSILLELTQKHVLTKTFKQYPRSASQQAQSYQENKKNSCSSLL
jgi:hypothetical protein